MKRDGLGRWFLGDSWHASQQPAVNLFILFILFSCTLSSQMLDASSTITSVPLPLATHAVVAMAQLRLIFLESYVDWC